MDSNEILEILNALYMQEYYDHLKLGVSHVDECDGRYYAVHPDSNVLSVFPPLDMLKSE